VLEPLARNRASVSGFLRNAGIAGQATAERGDDLEAQLEKFPETLRQVRATMKDLRGFADQGTPLSQDIAAVAPHLSKATQHLPAFFRAGTPALTTLGDAAVTAGPKLVAADPVVVQTKQLTDKAAPAAKDLSALLGTFNDTGGWQHFLDFVYNTSGNINGYDNYGHFQRALGIRSNCTDIRAIVFPSCEAFFIHTGTSAAGATPSASDLERAADEPQGGLAPGEPLPPLEEIVPEVEPDEADETTPTEPEEPAEEPESDQPDESESDAGTQTEAGSAVAAGLAERGLADRQDRQRRKKQQGMGQIDLQDAQQMLRFLFGGGS
jgi:hypothetical protein